MWDFLKWDAKSRKHTSFSTPNQIDLLSRLMQYIDNVVVVVVLDNPGVMVSHGELCFNNQGMCSQKTTILSSTFPPNQGESTFLTFIRHCPLSSLSLFATTMRPFVIPVIVLCIFCLGLALFLGFYFGLVRPEEDKQDRFDRSTTETCLIEKQHVDQYRCARKTSCKCYGCTAVPISCSERLQVTNSTGACCAYEEDQCCGREEREPYLCDKTYCHGSDGCRHELGTCYRTVCREWRNRQCQVDWGWCWSIIVDYTLNGTIRQHRVSCDFEEYSCVQQVQNGFRENTTKTCWLDPKEDTVSFSQPSDGNTAGPWVGAGIGIVLFTGALMIPLAIWIYYRLRHSNLSCSRLSDNFKSSSSSPPPSEPANSTTNTTTVTMEPEIKPSETI